jgi:hypothetical protein
MILDWYLCTHSTLLSWGHYVLSWFLPHPCPLLDLAGALTWAKLQLSLWNFKIMLPIKKSLDGIVMWHISMYSLSYWGHFVKNTKTVMNGISPNFYCMLIWWEYKIYHTIFWFYQFICPIGGAFWKLYVLLLIQNRTYPTLEFTSTAGAYRYLANVLILAWEDFSLCSMDVYLNSWRPLLS